MLVDATKVKAGHKERGESAYLAIKTEPLPTRYGWPTCQKRFVHLRVGTSTKLRQQLKAFGASHVFHDGGKNLEGCTTHFKRCRWHLGHQLKHDLWQGGAPPFFPLSVPRGMIRIVVRPKQGPQQFKRWQGNLATMGLRTAAENLKNVAVESCTYAKEPFASIDTSPLER